MLFEGICRSLLIAQKEWCAWSSRASGSYPSVEIGLSVLTGCRPLQGLLSRFGYHITKFQISMVCFAVASWRPFTFRITKSNHGKKLPNWFVYYDICDRCRLQLGSEVAGGLPRTCGCSLSSWQIIPAHSLTTAESDGHVGRCAPCGKPNLLGRWPGGRAGRADPGTQVHARVHILSHVCSPSNEHTTTKRVVCCDDLFHYWLADYHQRAVWLCSSLHV